MSKRSINLTRPRRGWAPVLKPREREQPGAQVQNTQQSEKGGTNCKSIKLRRCELQNTDKGRKSHGVEGKNTPPSVRTEEEGQKSMQYDSHW